jgi:uroporphyrinogen decarboxylase
VNRKERFLTALKFQKPDRVPLFDFLFQQPMYEALIGRRPGAYNAKDAVACALALDHDGVWIPFGGFSGYQPAQLSKNVYVDEWGTTYQQEAASWPIDSPIDYPIKSRADLAKYRPPDPTLPGRDAEIRAACLMPNDNLAICGGVLGPFSTAWMLMGYEAICYALYDDPELVTSCFRFGVEYGKEAARLSVAAGCSGIWISEDLGDSHAGFLSNELFKEHVLPNFAELVEYINGLGVPVLLHSCGCITQYLDDLAQTKIASVHPLQRTAKMDLRSVKEKYGKRFCIIGNIDSSRTLPYGTPADVEAEAKAAIEIAAPGGGYILASDHSLHDGIPVENIIALREAGRKYGRDFYKK